ncbi:hypothetical protein NQ314_016348 [Rhamnusium bicolor]|uniref:CCHC-type domain-containing protein n=1 Tax=Rhamnusium bicolor TaxID=1586634 RepID=A0AAV8WX84_9CUCU|nr:hypothetical protein NQ314_016348 [Rhamnusium bicolor]
MLRKRGNYLNSNHIQKAVKKGILGKELLPCSNCFGFYSKTQLWRHRKTCDANLTTKNSQVDAQNFMIRRLEIDEELKNKVFPRMRPDAVSLTAKTDTLICTFGARYLKIHREVHFVHVASRKMRELAKLIIEVKKMNSELTNLFKILSPENFDVIVQATKKIAQYDSDNELYKSPLYAMNISTSLKQCCDIAIIQAGTDLNMNKWNKVTMIPLATDLKLLKNYLIEKGNQAAAKLNSSGGETDYKILIETVYCRIILLNRRRPGELQRLLLNTYKQYSINKNQNYEEFQDAISPTEKILMQRFKRIVIRGKRGRGVPVLFSTDVQEHIDLLLNGYKVLQKYATSCGAKNPGGITCTKLRKHLTTLSQVFSMSEFDLELATFMGHTIGIHRQSYRLPDDIYQTSKIAKILLLMEKGTVGEFKGKTLEEINFDMEEDLSKTNDIDNETESTEIEPIENTENNINSANIIRGVATTNADIPQKRRFLRRELQKDLARPTVHVYETPNFSFETEKKEIDCTIESVTAMINDFDGINHEVYKRIRTRINHIMGRLQRIPETVNDDVSGYRGDNLIVVGCLEGDVEEIMDKHRQGEVNICRSLEEAGIIRQESQHTHSARRNRSTPETDLAYLPAHLNNRKRFNNYSNNNPSNRNEVREVSELRCFKCKKLGHIKRNCTQYNPDNSSGRKVPTCYGCGREGVIRPNCSCSKNYRRRDALKRLHNNSDKVNNLVPGKTTHSEWNAWKDLVRSFYSSTIVVKSPEDSKDFGSANVSTNGVNTESNMLLVQKKHDNRPYVSVKVLGKEVVALLDTGASHSVFGREGLQQINSFGLEICNLRETLLMVFLRKFSVMFIYQLKLETSYNL